MHKNKRERDQNVSLQRNQQNTIESNNGEKEEGKTNSKMSEISYS